MNSSEDLARLLGLASGRPLDGERDELQLPTGDPDDDPDDDRDSGDGDDAPGDGFAVPGEEEDEASALRADGEAEPAKGRGRPRKAPAHATPVRILAVDPPRPFVPPAERPYPVDADDALLPEPGFVSDFAYSCKGKESPMGFNIFAALFAVAVVSARKAEFKWAAGSFFPNLYLLFCAPPAACTKTLALERAHQLIQRLPDELMEEGQEYLAAEKRIEFISSSATPGGIMKVMEPRDELFMGPTGGMQAANFGSQAYVWADEFATFLSQEHYAEGLTNALTKWYDCREQDRETFKKESAVPLKDIYFNLAGALTPMHLQRSLPEQAYTGGFMSRVIVVSQQKPVNLFPLPVDYEGFPTSSTLLPRLAWIAANARGVYDFTDEAREFYKDFYIRTKTAYFESGTDTQNYARARHVHLVIRVAMLLRMAEYRPGNEVTLQNLLKAIELLEFTYSSAARVQSDIGASTIKKDYNRIRDYLSKQGTVSRDKLLKRMSKSGCLAQEVNALLEQLAQEGSIKMMMNGREKQGMSPSTAGNEQYVWTEAPQEGTNG